MDVNKEDNTKTCIRYLSSPNLSEQEYGLRVLINLTARSVPGNKLQLVIFKVIGIDVFSSLLCSRSEVIHMLAAWLLFHLTIAEENSSLVLQSGIVQYIASLLQSDNEDVVEKVLWLITNLSINSAHSHLLGEYGIVGLLSHLLGTANSTLLMSAAAQPLRNLLHKDLCTDFDENQRSFCHSNGMLIVKKILSTFPPPPEELLLWTTSILHVLSIHNPLIRRIMAAAGILPSIVALLTSPSTSEQIQEQVLKILVNLSLTPETEKSFITSQSVLPLVDVLLYHKVGPNLRQLVLSALANLSCNVEVRETLRYSGFATGLIELLDTSPYQAPSPGVEEAAAIVVANIAIDEILRLELLEVSGPAVVGRLMSSPSLAVRAAAQAALANLAIPIDPSVQGLQDLISSVFDNLVDEEDIDMDIIPIPDGAESKNVASVQQRSPPRDDYSDNRRSSLSMKDLTLKETPQAPPATPHPPTSHVSATPRPPTSQMFHQPVNTPTPAPNPSPAPAAHSPISAPTFTPAPTTPAPPTATPTPTGPPAQTLTSILHSSSSTTKPATPSPFVKQPSQVFVPIVSAAPVTRTPSTPNISSPTASPAISSPVVSSPAISPPVSSPTPSSPPKSPPLGSGSPTTRPTISRTVSVVRPVVTRRERIIKEIFDTETSYVKALGICIRVYLNPLVVNPANPPVLAPELVNTIFLNIQQIFKINCEFQKKLKGRLGKGGDVAIGDIFTWLWTETNVVAEYTKFINSFDNSLRMIEEVCGKNSRFREYLEKCQMQEASRSLTLQSFLIQPVQRVPRYILLLQDLVKHTPPEHADSKPLGKAVERTLQVAATLNEAKRNAESAAKMAKLQATLVKAPEGFSLQGEIGCPPRLLVREGSVMEVQKKGSKYIHLYLFDDMLLFTKQKKNKFSFQKVVPLVDLKMVDIPQNETGQHAFLLLWSSKQDRSEHEVTISCSKPEEKEYWMVCLKEALQARKKYRYTNSFNAH